MSTSNIFFWTMQKLHRGTLCSSLLIFLAHRSGVRRVICAFLLFVYSSSNIIVSIALGQAIYPHYGSGLHAGAVGSCHHKDSEVGEFLLH